MKKLNFTKVISILTVLAMVFSIAAFPAMAEGEEAVAPDLITDNIAYGKALWAAKYVSWYGADNAGTGTKVSTLPSGLTPSWATDGDLKTYHSGHGKVVNSKNSQNGVIVFVDLGAEYLISEVSVWQAKAQVFNIYTSLDLGTTPSSTKTNDYTKTQIGTTVADGSVTIDGATYNKSKLEVSNVSARYVFVEYNDRYDTNFHEIVIKGTPASQGGGASGGGSSSAESVEVDFTAAENVAYQKTVTSIDAGRYWGSSSPSGSKQWATDGVLIPDDGTSYHRGNGKTSSGSDAVTKGVSFYVDFGAEMKLSEFALYMPSNQPERTIKIYNGSAIDEGKLITTITAPESTVLVNGDEVFELSTALNDVIASQLTVSYEGGSDFAYYEIYAKGEKNIEKKNIDFTAAENIAYGKIVTPIKGSYYSSAPKPSDTNQKATDGDIETYHSGYGKEGSTTTGLEFSIDLGKEYKLSDIEIFLAKDQISRVYNVYKGTSVDANNLVATSTAAGKTMLINGKEVAPTHISFTEDVTTQQLTFRYDTGSGFAYYEIYIKGTAVTSGGGETPGEGGGETPDPDEPETPAGLEVDFKSKKNIAYDKVVTAIISGAWYDPGQPSSGNKILTDGNIGTGISTDGDSVPKPTAEYPNKGTKFYVDLGEEYDLEKLVLYGSNRDVNVYVGKLDTYDSDFKLLDASGQVATPDLTVIKGDAVEVNGTANVTVSTADLTGIKARYLTFEMTSSYSTYLKEIYIEKVYDPTDELSLSDITDEKAEEITADLTLPTALDNGATIVWKSSSPHIISADGKVTPGKEDAQVTLTAVMTMDGREFTKQFKLTVLASVEEYIAWENIIDLDFVEAERSGYSWAASDYHQNSANWSEEFLQGGGLKFINKGDKNDYLSFFKSIESEGTLASKYRFSFTMKTEVPDDSMRFFIYNADGKGISTVYIMTKDGKPAIGFGPTTSYTTRDWYVTDVDHSKEMKIDLVFDPAKSTVQAYVNGTAAVSPTDGSKSYSYSNGGHPAWAEYGFYKTGQSDAVYFLDMQIDRGNDPTGECNISALTEEDVDKITKDLTLMKFLKNGATVTWESSNPAVIDSDGKVTRARYDEMVTLTACITYNNQPLYKSFDFIVTAANKDKLNLILEHNDFASSAPYYVMTVPAGSSGAVKNGKLTLARSTEGDFSAEKFFVSDMKNKPYIVKGDKIILEQYLALKGGLDGGAATVRNEKGDTVATYGFREDGGEYEFFVSANGKEVTAPYSVGEELFIRFELSTSNATVNVLVNNKVITENPISVAADTGISSVKYEAGDGESGAFTIDGVTFMLEGTDHDRLKVKLDIANLTVLDLTTQDPENIVSDLTFSAVSRFGSTFKYESSKPEVISNEGFVTRQLEDTLVGVKVTLSKGSNKEEAEFTFKVRGANPDNLAIGQTAISGGAVSGFAEKNAVDGLMETVFKTSASEKYLTITFDKETMINKVILRETANEDGSYNVKAFTIDTSSDGYKWETAFTGTTVGAEAEITFDQVSSKYVRYAVTELDGNETGLSEFEVYYKPVSSVAAQLDMDAVAITPSDYVVSGDITLPTETQYGSTVTWKSSHPDIISDDGKLVSSPSSSTVITLTATVKNGDTVLTKKFTRSVTGTGSSSSGGSGGSGGGGGRVTSSGVSNTAGSTVNKEETPVTPSYTVFADVSEDRWSYNYIKELKDAGIVSGDGTNFYPTNNVTREEFVKMLVLSLGIEAGGETSFGDVESTAWYAPYVAAAVKAGIVNGISDTEFGVGRSISRQDMAVMTHRALEKLSIDVEPGASHIFTDGDEIAGYAKDAIDILSGAGILSGDGGKFAPLDSLTREQAAKVLCMIRKEITE